MQAQGGFRGRMGTALAGAGTVGHQTTGLADGTMGSAEEPSDGRGGTQAQLSPMPRHTQGHGKLDARDQYTVPVKDILLKPIHRWWLRQGLG